MQGDEALWFVGPRHVELRPIELPALGVGEVAVRTCCSGISAGTELLAFRGQLPSDLPLDESIAALDGGSFDYPFRYGYSAVGVVEAVGPDVHRGLAVGDVVFAFHPHQARFHVAADAVVPVGDLPPRLATLLPYVETAFQVTLDAGPVFGDDVVVSGLGVLGTLIALLVERAGARVIAVEPQAWRRDLAAGLGVTAVAPGELPAVVAERGAVPLAIECSGSPSALAPLLDVVAHEGTVLVASWYGSREVALPLGGAFHRRRLTIRSTQVSTIPAAQSSKWTPSRRIARAVELAAGLPLAALATDTVDIAAAADAYARLDSGTSGVMHVAFGYR